MQALVWSPALPYSRATARRKGVRTNLRVQKASTWTNSPLTPRAQHARVIQSHRLLAQPSVQPAQVENLVIQREPIAKFAEPENLLFEALPKPNAKIALLEHFKMMERATPVQIAR